MAFVDLMVHPTCQIIDSPVHMQSVVQAGLPSLKLPTSTTSGMQLVGVPVEIESQVVEVTCEQILHPQLPAVKECYNTDELPVPFCVARL
jgi:hypothetical protein